MDGIQNLIICVKMARSEHLTGSDCGDEYSLNTLQKSAIYLYFLPETSEKTKAIDFSGKSGVMPLISILIFVRNHWHAVGKSKNCCLVLCFSHESTKGTTWGLPEKMISSSDQCNQNYEVLRRTISSLSLSWRENLVRLCYRMLPSDKIALKHLPGTIREPQPVNYTRIQVSVGTLFAFVICFTICIYHT